MKVTVIIPNYNGIEYIEACLDSLYGGSMVPEVIVIDNASSDGSDRLVEQKFPQCQLVRLQENTGFDTAVNEGIRRADTEYVILLNNDTRADKDFVKNLYKAISSKKEAFSVAAKMLSMGEPDIIDDAGDLYCALGWAYALGKGKEKSHYTVFAEIFAACAGAAIYRKEIFDRIGYFDEQHFAYLEDIDIAYRARINGWRNYYTPDAIVYHAGSATSGSRYNDFKVRLAARNSIYLIYKNMPVFQMILNLPFLLSGLLIKFLFFVKKGMGFTYAKGIAQGLALCASKEGRRQKVRYHFEYSGNYISIQLELWKNIIRRITG